MKIVVIADPYIPVPPVFYGGAERVVAFLARGLAARGHEVTLFAHPESSATVRLFAYGSPPHKGLVARGRELAQVWRGLRAHAVDADIVHSFGRLGGLAPILARRTLPKIQSYGRDPVPSRSRLALAARLAGPSLELLGCSQRLFRDVAHVGSWRRIFNGVEMELFPCVDRVDADAPLVFLGRLERIKGPHHAIEIARRSGRRLLLAGNIVTDGGEPNFFAHHIAPFVDDDRIRYLGPVDDRAKAALLGQAAALLMPIEWDEPFGIVMAEALACGTPVVAFERGSVPEVVRDGETGYVCRTVDEAVGAVTRLARLDRRAVRLDCERRFAADVIVTEHESLYEEMVERCASSS